MIMTSDTWEWDGKQWNLTLDSVAGLGNRHHITMMYDESQSMTLLAGGVKLSDDKENWIWPNDIWGWNGKSWAKLNEGGPKERISIMAYDCKKHETILFGGSPAEGESEKLYNDTWIWNGKTWRKHNGTNPPPRNGHAMTYDSDRNVMLLFGGWSNNGRVKLADMWQWDGKDWTEIKLSGNKPGGRGIAGMVYDPNRKVAVLFGGDGEKGKLKDTWEWDGTKWSEVKK
jgi:Galactose oxidase, central domain